MKEVKGICALYYVLGDYDFTAVIKAESIKDLESILNKISLIDGVERSNTITVLSIKKEDLTEFNRID
ncbi:Lrp/AsnC ligand binding domain-containing protein [Acidiplasma cupricumulans]|uniref:Lrp/AsnC ligand binding domain-containing protein n=1 Tax=Acidiplasma cupricumulans TaxID=312540 RepID=UPI001584EAC9|nr:Lrp/AsnC ligand binding domain-containing protein [Acidiplasma cupricumulans]